MCLENADYKKKPVFGFVSFRRFFEKAALKPVDLVDESEVAPPEVAPPTEEVELESEPPEVGHHPEAMG